MGESDMERALPDLIRRDRKPTVGITASYATITLRITTEGDTTEECELQAADTIKTIEDCLGNIVYAHHECEIQDSVAKQFSQSKRRLAVLESGTCGLVSHNLPSVKGINNLIARCELRSSLCDGYTLEKLELVAKNFHNSHDAHFSIIVGDVLEATEKTGPVIHVAIVTEQETRIEEFRYTGHSNIRVAKAAKQAINSLRLYILSSDDSKN